MSSRMFPPFFFKQREPRLRFAALFAGDGDFLEHPAADGPWWCYANRVADSGAMATFVAHQRFHNRYASGTK